MTAPACAEARAGFLHAGLIALTAAFPGAVVRLEARGHTFSARLPDAVGGRIVELPAAAPPEPGPPSPAMTRNAPGGRLDDRARHWRDAMIVAAYAAGHPTRDVAAWAGVSEPRVHQIITASGVTRRPRTWTANGRRPAQAAPPLPRKPAPPPPKPAAARAPKATIQITPKPSPPLPIFTAPRFDHAWRDAMVLAARDAGVLPARIAIWTGVDRSRIFQLLKRARDRGWTPALPAHAGADQADPATDGQGGLPRALAASDAWTTGAPPPGALTLDALGADQCRWPHGPPTAPAEWFCAAPVADEGGSWCPRHRALAFERIPQRPYMPRPGPRYAVVR